MYIMFKGSCSPTATLLTHFYDFIKLIPLFNWKVSASSGEGWSAWNMLQTVLCMNLINSVEVGATL